MIRKIIGLGLIILIIGWFFDWNWYLIAAIWFFSTLAEQIRELSDSTKRQEQLLESLQEKIDNIQDRVSVQTEEFRFMEDRLSSKSGKYYD